jgi:hypothetical protein
MKINNLHDFRDAEALIWNAPGVGVLYHEFRDALFATQVRLHNTIAGNTQKAINDALKDLLRRLGWTEWVPNPELPRNKSDFRKASPVSEVHAIGAEVQFSNMAKVSDDLTKLNFGILYKQIDVALLVIPSREMARLMDENLPPFDRVVRELEQRKEQFRFLRVLVIEMTHDGLIGVEAPRRRERPAKGRGYSEEKLVPEIRIDYDILGRSEDELHQP